MNNANGRLEELASLIHARQIELETLQIALREAYARKLDPAELLAKMADLGHQQLAWEREWVGLLRERTE